jgi:hypothetical protein
MRLSVEGRNVTVSATADLRPYWQAVRGRQFSEVGLDAGEDSPAMAMLVNGARAWLMDLRDREGDPGLRSRVPGYSGPPDALSAFVLNNGQLDKYPSAWTIPTEQAMAACERFVATRGGRSPEIVRHVHATDDKR